MARTSRSWDRGRDGRTLGPHPKAFLCATLNAELEQKVVDDLSAIAKSGARVERVYYCAPQLVSDHTLDGEVEEKLRPLFPNSVVDFQPLGEVQLSQFGHEHQDLLWKYYPAELEDCLRELDDDGDDLRRDATLLALATTGHPNSGAVRESAYRMLLLSILSDGVARSPNELARDLSARLRLANSLSVAAIQPYVDALWADGLVVDVGGRASMSGAGLEAATEAKASAAAELLEGRSIFRAELEASLGFVLADQQFEKIWQETQSRLTNFFYTQGHKMLATVERFSGLGVRDGADDSEITALPFFLDELAAAAAKTCSKPEIGKEVDVAIRDIFRERCGKAYEWLGRVCVTFVIACTLGLEVNCGRAVRDALSGAHLVLDTDVLLELLGDGEPGNESAKHVVKQWPLLGGRLLLADAVLEEVAHHAWIAENDYEEARDRFLKTELERRRFVRNVFVRAFGYLTETRASSPRDWRKFIAMFRGVDARDASQARNYLTENYKFGRLPEGDIRRPPGSEVAQHLHWLANKDNQKGKAKKISHDKAERDARLFAALHNYATALMEQGTKSTCILVTSSGRLRNVRDRFGTPTEATITLGEAAYLLTMVPGSAISLSALRTMLFDQRVLPHSDDLERLVLRAIQDAGEFTLPWARRGAVSRRVRTQLLAIAKDRGETRLQPDQILQQTDDDARATLSSVIAQALRDAGAEPKLEAELSAARRRIHELEEKLRKKSKE